MNKYIMIVISFILIFIGIYGTFYKSLGGWEFPLLVLGGLLFLHNLGKVKI